MQPILKSKSKKVWRGFRIPVRLDEMIVDMQRLLGGEANYTDALIAILVDWEKFRYLEEKKRLLELAKLRYQLIKQESKRNT